MTPLPCVQLISRSAHRERRHPSPYPPWSERPDGDLRRLVEQAVDLVVETAERDRAACHVERRAVLADVVAPHVAAPLRELAVCPPVEQVQLADRGAAEAVDHERDVVAAGER